MIHVHPGVLKINISSKPALHQHRIPSPPKATFTKSSFESLHNSAHEHELHLVADLKRNVVFNILAVRPWQNDFLDLRTMGSQNL